MSVGYIVHFYNGDYAEIKPEGVELTVQTAWQLATMHFNAYQCATTAQGKVERYVVEVNGKVIGRFNAKGLTPLDILWKGIELYRNWKFREEVW